jgi:hypothetical protein
MLRLVSEDTNKLDAPMNRNGFDEISQDLRGLRRACLLALCLTVSLGTVGCDYAPFESVACRFDDDCVAGAFCVQRFCRFEDAPMAIAEVVVEPESLSLVIGETALLTATGRDADGRQVEGAVYWSVSDGAVAQIGANGRLQGLSAGSTMIRATMEVDGQSRTGNAAVEVRCGGVNTVEVDELLSPLEVGANFQMSAVVVDGCQEEVEAPVLVWAVEDSSIASINSSTGVLTGKVTGSTRVIGTVDGVSGEVTISVTQSEITSIEINLQGSSDLPVGEQRPVRVIFYAGGQVVEIEGSTIVWHSEPAWVVAISARGHVATLEAKAEGSAQISAKYSLPGGGELTAEESVTVVGVCADTSCNRRGACVVVLGQPTCECEPGYSGASCEGCDVAGGYFPDGSDGCVNPLLLGMNALEPEVWLDAADMNSVVQLPGSNVVERWRDRTAKGHDALPALSNFPELAENGGKQFLSFAATPLEVRSNMTVGTVFVVARYGAGDGQVFEQQSGLFSGKGGAADSQRVYFTGEANQRAWLNLSPTDQHRSRLTTKFVNGVEPIPSPHAIPGNDLRDWMIFSGTDADPVSHGHWFIGSDRAADSFPWVGDVAEILIYEVALLQEDRKQIEGYLNEKWRIYSPSPGP